MEKNQDSVLNLEYGNFKIRVAKKIRTNEHQNANSCLCWSGGLSIPFYPLYFKPPIMCFYNENTKKKKMYISILKSF